MRNEPRRAQRTQRKKERKKERKKWISDGGVDKEFKFI